MGGGGGGMKNSSLHFPDFYPLCFVCCLGGGWALFGGGGGHCLGEEVGIVWGRWALSHHAEIGKRINFSLTCTVRYVNMTCLLLKLSFPFNVPLPYNLCT